MALKIFDPLLCDFDGIILMRRESIPQADSALRHPRSTGGRSVRRLAKLLGPAGFQGNEEDLIVPPKSARVLLRNMPKREAHLYVIVFLQARLPSCLFHIDAVDQHQCRTRCLSQASSNVTSVSYSFLSRLAN